jgi:hypothetical protein
MACFSEAPELPCKQVSRSDSWQIQEKKKNGSFVMTTNFVLAKIPEHPWITPIILAIWEAETGRIEVRGHPVQTV